jgi:hypothetical protein
VGEEAEGGDEEFDRLEYAAPQAGFFHISMANVDAVIHCNWGPAGGGCDPSCHSRFVAVLGHSGITEDGGENERLMKMARTITKRAV